MKIPVYQDMLLIQVQNICFSFTKCSNSCPYKCGFDYHKYRCFFNTPTDTTINFDSSVFHDRNKNVPALLDKVVHKVCSVKDDATICTDCAFYNEECYCMILDTLRHMAKIKEGEN